MSDEGLTAEPTDSNAPASGQVQEAQAGVGRLDNAISSRRAPAATILQAKTGLALANGAKSLAAAMVEGGYSPWTARVPSANGITPARALAAAAEVFPEAPTATSIKRDGLDLIHKAMQKANSDPETRPMELAQIGGSAAKLGHEIGGGDDQDKDLQAAASLEDFNVHNATMRLEMAQQLTAEGADVQAILAQLQADLEAALESQALFQLTHGRKATQ